MNDVWSHKGYYNIYNNQFCRRSPDYDEYDIINFCLWEYRDLTDLSITMPMPMLIWTKYSIRISREANEFNKLKAQHEYIRQEHPLNFYMN